MSKENAPFEKDIADMLNRRALQLQGEVSFKLGSGHSRPCESRYTARLLCHTNVQI